MFANLQGMGHAANGSLVAGDIITAVNGKAVKSVTQLQAFLDERRIGDVAKLTVQREGKAPEVVVVELQAGEWERSFLCC